MDDPQQLRQTIDRQLLEIAELKRPRHWRSAGVRGAQAEAWHESLDRLISYAITARRRLKIGWRSARTAPHAGDRSDAARRRLHQLDAVDRSGLEPHQLAWLTALAARGVTPTDSDVAAANERLGVLGHQPATALAAVPELTESSDWLVRFVTDRVLVDVTQTASQGYHTGIQRVVREAALRWASDPRVLFVWWDDQRGIVRPLGDADVQRLTDTRRPHVDVAAVPYFDLDTGPVEIVVPIGTRVVIPEVVPEPARVRYYATLVGLGLCEIGLIGYDMIPITAAETRADDADGWFPRYLSLVKQSARVAAISTSTADEFSAFGTMLASQGLTGPIVRPIPLPAEHHAASDDDIAETVRELGIGDGPVVLVIGTIEPRKNHRTVLEAAERLWDLGHEFQLVLAGGWGWSNDDVYAEAHRSIDRGRRLTFVGACSEATLWALYRIARFTVFPSLLEGFGLPIAESLASGTPVITANYGAMAELATGGGALCVDPRDVEDMAKAMLTLLDDEVTLEQLRHDARCRSFRSWSEYSAEVWDFLMRPSVEP